MCGTQKNSFLCYFILIAISAIGLRICYKILIINNKYNRNCFCCIIYWSLIGEKFKNILSFQIIPIVLRDYSVH